MEKATVTGMVGARIDYQQIKVPGYNPPKKPPNRNGRIPLGVRGWRGLSDIPNTLLNRMAAKLAKTDDFDSDHDSLKENRPPNSKLLKKQSKRKVVQSSSEGESDVDDKPVLTPSDTGSAKKRSKLDTVDEVLADNSFFDNLGSADVDTSNKKNSSSKSQSNSSGKTSKSRSSFNSISGSDSQSDTDGPCISQATRHHTKSQNGLSQGDDEKCKIINSDIEDGSPTKRAVHKKRRAVIEDSDSDANEATNQNQSDNELTNENQCLNESSNQTPHDIGLITETNADNGSASENEVDDSDGSSNNKPTKIKRKKRQRIKASSESENSSDDDVPLTSGKRRSKLRPGTKPAAEKSDKINTSTLDPDLFDAEGSSDDNRAKCANNGSQSEESEEEDEETVNKLSSKYSGPAGKKASKSAKKVAKQDEKLKIYSEKQRMLREQAVTVPIYQPPKRSLREFLSEQAPQLLTALRSHPKDGPMTAPCYRQASKPGRPPKYIEEMEYMRNSRLLYTPDKVKSGKRSSRGSDNSKSDTAMEVSTPVEEVITPLEKTVMHPTLDDDDGDLPDLLIDLREDKSDSEPGKLGQESSNIQDDPHTHPILPDSQSQGVLTEEARRLNSEPLRSIEEDDSQSMEDSQAFTMLEQSSKYEKSLSVSTLGENSQTGSTLRENFQSNLALGEDNSQISLKLEDSQSELTCKLEDSQSQTICKLEDSQSQTICKLEGSQSQMTCAADSQSQVAQSSIAVFPKPIDRKSRLEAKKERLRRILGDSVDLDIVPQLSCDMDGVVLLGDVPSSASEEKSMFEVFKESFEQKAVRKMEEKKRKQREKSTLRVVRNLPDGSQHELSMDSYSDKTSEETGGVHKLAVLKQILKAKIAEKRSEEFKKKVEMIKMEALEEELPEDEILDDNYDFSDEEAESGQEEAGHDEEEDELGPVLFNSANTDLEETSSARCDLDKDSEIMKRVRAVLDSDDEEGESTQQTQESVVSQDTDTQIKSNHESDTAPAGDTSGTPAAAILGFTREMFSTQQAEDEILGLCSGQFTSSQSQAEEEENKPEEPKQPFTPFARAMNKDGLQAAQPKDDAPVAEPGVKSVVTGKKKEALHFSDEEDSDDELNEEEMGAELDDDDEEAGPDEEEERDELDELAEDSDDEEQVGDSAAPEEAEIPEPMETATSERMLVLHKPRQTKRQKLMGEYLDKEAELSGDEGGSDEDLDFGEEDDVLELEKGDLDHVGTEEQLRSQVAKAHLKQSVDDDARELMLMKEMLLPDGDLHSDSKRQRKFRWRNVEYRSDGINRANDSEGEDASDDENGLDPEVKRLHERLEKERVEREAWLKEQRELRVQKELDESQPQFSFDSNDNNKAMLAPPHQPTAFTFNLGLNKKKPGYILGKSKKYLERFKELHKNIKSEQSGPISAKNLLFRPISKEDAESQQEMIWKKA